MNDRKLILRDSLIGTAACALILFLKMIRSDGGTLPTESYGFLIHYTQARPLLEMIFDPQINDWGYYQARELSYFFDWIDTRFIAASIKAGWVHVYSLTSFLAFTATAFVLQYSGRLLFRRLPAAVITLGTVLLILSPVTGELTFFRSAKPLTMLLAVLCCALFSFYCRYRRASVLAGIFAALLLLNVVDRQGAFFCAAFAVFSCMTLVAGALRWRMFRERGFVFLAFGSFLCVFAGALYNGFFAPRIIFSLNGYFPSFAYQQIDSLSIVGIAAYGSYFLSGNIGHNFSGLFGINSVLVGASLMLLQLAALRSYWPRLVLIASWCAMIGCAGVMIIRHFSVLLPDVIYGFYFCPFLGILIFLAFFTGNDMSARGRRVLMPVLGVAVAVQLALVLFPREVPSHQQIYRDNGPVLLRALREPDFDYRREVMPHHVRRLIEHFNGVRKVNLGL